MDNKQIGYIILGLTMFVSVIYLSSHSQAVVNPLGINIKLEKNSIHYQSKTKVKQIPNFVFILTDDQDSVLGGAQHMPYIHNNLLLKGIEFKNSFVASPLCCPSRSSILTGQYVHNHKTRNNSISGGCSSKSWQNGPEKKTFVNLLHQAGYQTFFGGKYLNAYGNANVGGLSHIPPGWDWWVGLEGNSKYYNYNLSINGTVESHGHDSNKDYLTNVIKNQSLRFLYDVQSREKPFFMMISTPACHAPFDSEPKYENRFNNLKAPRTKNFNIPNDASKHWLLRLGEQPLKSDLVDKIDQIARKRLRTLLSVDDLVESVVSELKAQNLLESTYIIFTSDNGYHLGQFSLPLDKREPYETDIRVPFYIVGPGISHGTLNNPITNIDIAPTILDLAGIPIPQNLDGISLKSFIEAPNVAIETLSIEKSYFLDKIVPSASLESRKTVLIEHSGEGKPLNYGCEHLGPNLSGCNVDFACKCEDSFNNTYSCLRHFDQTDNFVFCAWEDDQNFEEYYALNEDEDQLHNIVDSLSKSKRKKLKNLLQNYQKCKGAKCAKLSNFIF